MGPEHQLLVVYSVSFASCEVMHVCVSQSWAVPWFACVLPAVDCIPCTPEHLFWSERNSLLHFCFGRTECVCVHPLFVLYCIVYYKSVCAPVSECLFLFGAQRTCFSTPSSADRLGLTRFVSDQSCALFVTPVRLASIVCVHQSLSMSYKSFASYQPYVCGCQCCAVPRLVLPAAGCPPLCSVASVLEFEFFSFALLFWP